MLNIYLILYKYLYIYYIFIKNMTYFTARKQDPILGLVNSYVIDSPEPSNISYWWNLGSLLGVVLILQIITGIFLVMHYTSHITMAFSSVDHKNF